MAGGKAAVANGEEVPGQLEKLFAGMGDPQMG